MRITEAQLRSIIRSSLIKESFLSGKVEGYDIGVDKSLDLDSEFDFELIEYLMKKKYKKS